jgi:hypothetical protein
MIKKLLMPLLITVSVSATPPQEITLQEVKTALSVLKQENKELSVIFPELHEDALLALDESYPFKGVDVLIRALEYICERLTALQVKLEPCDATTMQ